MNSFHDILIASRPRSCPRRGVVRVTRTCENHPELTEVRHAVIWLKRHLRHRFRANRKVILVNPCGYSVADYR